MLKIGLTGGIASGKSTVCKLFSQHKIPIIDADIIAQQLVMPGQDSLPEIVQLFGPKILNNDGSLNRQTLRQLIFSDDIAKQQLEKILHPKIRQQLQQQSEKQLSSYCILAIPLLVEANMNDLVERILVLDIAPSLQLERLCQRDDISVHDAQLIINKQCSSAQRLAVADDVIRNNGSFENLAFQIQLLHQKYSTLAS